ncbi:RNA-dependent RNA polymerase [Operophtera brumata reovirus]|uniref:RNA-dependent RNA polymerase n=1 Tax=Operophtera brumata reovirus TaxID=352248 RepID=UPI00005D6836|nr:RNA-dependent RNA polymerase [Operophtera brumata reovirus]ABB17205.1 RNA-dependent RNA polymerase [Operophtera brumata reovirus]
MDSTRQVSLTLQQITKRLHLLISTQHNLTSSKQDTLTVQTNSIAFKAWYDTLQRRTDILFNKTELTLEDITGFDTSSQVGIYHTSLILLLLQEIKFRVTLSSSAESDLERIVSPPHYEFGTSSFRVNELDQHIEAASVRYVLNYDAYKIVRDAEAIQLVSKKVRKVVSDELLEDKIVQYSSGDVNLYREADVMHGLVIKYVSQPRLLPIPKLIQMIIETSNFPERGFELHENPVLYIISRLLSKYIDFPFTEKSGEMVYHHSVSMTTPHLIYSLSQLWIQYILNNVTRSELYMMVECHVMLSVKSFDEFVLEFKDLRINSSKILTEMVKQAFIPIYGSVAPAGIMLKEDFSDIWRDGEREQFGTDFLQLCPMPLQKYLTDRRIIVNSQFTLGKIFEDDNEARRTHLIITLSTQHGLFIKNPVIFTIDKSVHPRPSLGVGYDIKEYMVNPSDQTDSYPLTLLWKSSVTQSIRDELLGMIRPYGDRIRSMDLFQEFIRCLTNNSGGIPYEPTPEETKTIPAGVLRALGRKRLMFFLLNPTVFSVYSAWRKAVETPTSSGERKQVDRRGRVIQMVSNPAQIGAFLLFLIADTIGSQEPEFSSKKNSGTINDMMFQLSESGVNGVVYECADVKGMDAATTKTLCALTGELVVDLFREHNGMTYFWAQSKDWNVVDSNGTSRRERIAAPIEVFRACEKFADTTPFRLHEPETFGHVTTSPDSFPSGKFSTNAQHSFINAGAVRSWGKSFNRQMLQSKDSNERLTQPVRVTSLISGDDLTIKVIYGNETVKALLAFSDGLQRHYANIGLSLESVLSKYSATFLQMTAVLGKPWPKADRISIVTSEHGDAQRVEFREAMAEVIDVLRELSGRSGIPSNWVPIALVMGNMLRRLRVVISDTFNPVTEEHLQDDRILKRGNSIYIKIPFITLFIKEGLGLPFLATNFLNRVERQLSYAPRGSLSDWHLRRILLKRDPFEYITSNGSQRIYDFYAHYAQELHEKRLMSDISAFEDAERRIIAEVYGTPSDWYDGALADKLDLDLAVYIAKFDPSTRVKQARRRAIPASERDRWTRNLASQLNFQAITKSALAHMTLKELRYNVPEEIAFHHSPAERINQLLESVQGGYEEFMMLRRESLLYRLRYKPGVRWIGPDSIESLLLFNPVILDSEYELHRDVVLDRKCKYMPSSTSDFDRTFGAIQIWDTTSLKIFKVFSGYYGYRPGPFKEYNHEALVKFAAQVYHTNPTHLPYVWHLANIQGRHRQTLSRMIKHMAVTLGSSWGSTVHTRQLFEIGKDPRAIIRCFELPSRLHQRAEDTAALVARDLHLAYGSYGLNQVMIQLHPLFIRQTDGTRERNTLLRMLTKKVIE